MNDSNGYNNDNEKIQRIRELSEQIITNSSQAKAMLALVVEGDFTSLDAHTQHDYLCVLDDKVTTAMNLHKGITMLCG